MAHTAIRSAVTNQNGSSSIAPGVVPHPDSFIVVAASIASSGQTVSSITSGGGTWTRIYNGPAVGDRVEIWIGYGFPANATTVTVNYTGTGGWANCVLALDYETDWAASCASTGGTLPSAAANAGAQGSGTSADSGSITPAVGDLLLAACAYASQTAPSAINDTGLTLATKTQAYTGALTGSWGFLPSPAAAATATDRVWTIPSSVWSTVAVKITPGAAAPPTTGFVYKGRDTATADSGNTVA